MRLRQTIMKPPSTTSCSCSLSSRLVLAVLILTCLVQNWTCPSLKGQRRPAGQGSYDAASIESGTRLFGESCSVCHGIDGRGSARGPDLTRGLVVNRGGDDEVAKVIREGIPHSSMPPFALPETEIRHLVAFIRSLSIKAASLSVAGNQELGRQIFFGKAGCSECHMIRGHGGLLGPDLSNLGSERTLAEIRQSVLKPGLSEDQKYWPITVVTKAGTRITGTLRNRDNYSIQMMDSSGTFHFFSNSELRETVLQEKSAMPNNYEKLLSKAELKDLLAFLSRQTVAD